MRANIARGKAMFEAECRDRGIRVIVGDSHKGGAAWWHPDDGVPEITTPPIRGNVSLATAFHELGHIVLGHNDANTEPAMKQELDAWGYAHSRLAESGVNWTVAIGAHAVACMATRTEDDDARTNGDGNAGNIVKALRLLRKVGLV